MKEIESAKNSWILCDEPANNGPLLPQRLSISLKTFSRISRFDVCSLLQLIHKDLFDDGDETFAQYLVTFGR